MLAPSLALSGAWTQPPGAVFLSSAGSYFRSEGEDPFTQYETELYGELGVLPWLTLGAAATAREPVGRSADSASEIEISGLARIRLERFDGIAPLSVQFRAISVIARGPEGYGNDGLVSDLKFSPHGADIEARLLFGRGFSGPLGEGWFDIQGGPRIRTSPNSHELRIDATFGLRPARDWLIMAQSFRTFSMGKAEYYLDNYHSAKLALSVGYRLTEEMTVVLGAERQIWGWRSDPGTRIKLGLWRRFDLF